MKFTTQFHPGKSQKVGINLAITSKKSRSLRSRIRFGASELLDWKHEHQSVWNTETIKVLASLWPLALIFFLARRQTGRKI